MRFRGSGHLGRRSRLHLQACTSAREIILGLFDPETQSLLEMPNDTKRQAVTYRNLRATRAEPLEQSHTSQVEVIFQTCNFSAYLRTTSHNSPIKMWQQFTTATLSAFSLLFTRSSVRQLWKLLVEFAETEKWRKLEACNVHGRLSQSVNRDCRHFHIS